MINLIYVTHKNEKEAEKIISHLLEKKLIACANIFPITSFFSWKGKIENEKEVVTILKTDSSKWENVKKEIVKIHPYETPCILKLSTEGSKGFAKWVGGEVK